MRQTPHRVRIVYQAKPAVSRSALVAFLPVLFGAGAGAAVSLQSRSNLSLALSRFGVELHSEESSIAIRHTCSTCANLKCTCTFVSVRSI